MELNIKMPSSRILLEKVDNGIVLYEIGEDNVVTSKLVYEMYYKDGIIDFDSMGNFMMEIMEFLKIPTFEKETNRQLGIIVTKIDPSKPIPDEFQDEEDEDEEQEPDEE